MKLSLFVVVDPLGDTELCRLGILEIFGDPSFDCGCDLETDLILDLCVTGLDRPSLTFITSLLFNPSLFNFVAGEFDLDLKLSLVGELLLELLLELFLEATTLLAASILASLSESPISFRIAASSSIFFLSASTWCFSLFSSLISLIPSMFSFRKFLGECACKSIRGGKVAVEAILSILDKELVLLLGGGELVLEFAAEVLGVLWRDDSSRNPRP